MKHTLGTLIIIGIAVLVMGHYWIQTDRMMKSDKTYEVR